MSMKTRKGRNRGLVWRAVGGAQGWQPGYLVMRPASRPVAWVEGTGAPSTRIALAIAADYRLAGRHGADRPGVLDLRDCEVCQAWPPKRTLRSIPAVRRGLLPEFLFRTVLTRVTRTGRTSPDKAYPLSMLARIKRGPRIALGFWRMTREALEYLDVAKRSGELIGPLNAPTPGSRESTKADAAAAA